MDAYTPGLFELKFTEERTRQAAPRGWSAGAIEDFSAARLLREGDREALRIIVKACVEASRVREDLADIINVAIEELLRERFELPGFTTLFPCRSYWTGDSEPVVL